MNPWEVTIDDLINILDCHGIELSDEQLNKVHDNLNHAMIEDAALSDTDFDKQVEYAQKEIERQLKENKIIPE